MSDGTISNSYSKLGFRVPLKIKRLDPRAQVPVRGTVGAAGMDLHALLDEDVTIQPGDRFLVPTGIAVEVPMGYEVQVRPRSGLALRHGITLMNSPGTVDSDYRGDVSAMLVNHGTEPFVVKNGMRVSQIIVQKLPDVDVQIVDELTDTERGSDGFGSTGGMGESDIKYVIGDATRPENEDNNMFIAHICNNVGRWGAGFTNALDQRWSAPREDYLKWNFQVRHEGGHIQLVQVERNMGVVNMVAQRGVRGYDNKRPLRYAWLDQCLQQLAGLAIEYKATVHMPRIGCGLAGGSWDRIEPLIREHLCRRGVSVTVYDLPSAT